MNDEMLQKARLGLSLGWSVRQTALYTGISADTLAYQMKKPTFIHPTTVISNRDTIIKQWAKLNDHQTRIYNNTRGYEVDLPNDYLFFLYVAQMGKCFYTGTELKFNQTISNAISVDRVDQSKGYLEGNVVLTTVKINSVKLDATLEEMRTWMPKWAKAIEEDFSPLVDGVQRLSQKYAVSKCFTQVRMKAIQCELLDYLHQQEANIFKFE
jgi:hypothetical protein